ncbi:zinc metalloprotease [Streptomyces sp. Ru73]|uniref:M1 family metallopeptidase n=1 Tax=Streptomyces sp. Ru73 TaxID=2080748 RepID=UPI000CDD965D|nr:M1 family metallopeptidase [Streptomyces sp. Ru73]POX39148.1 zinc metalloprotease [Streptomyces sp. Ru73]
MSITPRRTASPTRQAPDLPGPAAPRRRAARRAVPAVLAVGALLAAGAPEPGPEGLGDRLYPYLGNPGYDVDAYDIALKYSGKNDVPLDAVTTISARATGHLDRVNLDFARGTVRSVEVNGVPARHATRGEDLVITPAQPVEPGQGMRIVVRHTSDPMGAKDGGWVRTGDGLAMANQADAAHRVFPSNDHPSDKAVFTFRITAPRGVTAVANGLPLGRTARGPATTWTYRSLHPMATELAQVSLGKSAVVHRKGPHGLPLRDVVPAADRKKLEPWLAKTPGQIGWLERQVGAYPFETYGVLLADASTGFELETQTLSLFEKHLFTTDKLPAWYVESLMVHELAHQWFGDSVTPRTWSDVWLNESHATWYEARYADRASKGTASLEERMKRAYEESDAWRAAGGPPAAPKPPKPGQKIGIFRPVVYDGSALILYALRQRMGAAAFDRLERAWFAEHRDGVVSTADFVALASRIHGEDLTGFLRPWLYGTRTPPMPGHPDWHVRKDQKQNPPPKGGSS